MDKSKQYIMYGFIAGIVMVIIHFILYLTDLSFEPGVSYISNAPFLICIILNAIAFSKANDGFVTFGSVFGNCFKASIVVTIAMIAWSVISIFLFSEMREHLLTITHDAMLKNPKMTEEQVDFAISTVKKFWNPIIIASAIFSTLFYGIIFSLIGAIFAKKNGPRLLL